MKILITGACGVTSRSVARGLRRDYEKKIWLCGAGIFKNEYARHEGIYDLTVKLPFCNDKNYPNEMKALLRSYDFDCALVIPEREVLLWSTEQFRVPFLLPSASFIAAASDKKELVEALKDSQFVPKSVFLYPIMPMIVSLDGVAFHVGYAHVTLVLLLAPVPLYVNQSMTLKTGYQFLPQM